MKYLFLIFLLLGKIVFSETISIHNENYKTAEAQKDYLKFSMVSWKLGVFKSTFKGYVKNFKIDYEVKDHFVEKSKVSFKVTDIDTDINSRNEKMWNFCFDNSHFPEIEIRFEKSIDLNVSSVQVLPAKIKIRGKEYDIQVNVNLSKENDNYRISGNSILSLKYLEIPDPSIAVGSVEDGIEIDFKIERFIT